MAETFEKAEKDSTIIAALAAFFGSLIAIIIYLIKKDDRFVRFYALQSFIFDIVAGIVITLAYVVMFFASFVLSLGAAASRNAAPEPAFFLPMACFGIVMLAYLVVRLFCAYKAFCGEVFMLPLVGRFVAKYV